MKIKDIVIYNNKKWRVIAIVGNYARIRLLNSGAEKIIEIKDLRESVNYGNTRHFKRIRKRNN